MKKLFLLAMILGLLVSGCVGTTGTAHKQVWVPSVWTSDETWAKDKHDCYLYARSKAETPGKDMKIPTPSGSLSSNAWGMFGAVMDSSPDRINSTVFDYEWKSCLRAKGYKEITKEGTEKEIQENREYYKNLGVTK